MKYILITLLFILPQALIGQRTIDFRGLSEKNEVYYYNNTPFTGKSIRKFDNGKNAQEATWKDGLLHGLKSEWGPTGLIREKMNFEKGYRQGEFSKYYSRDVITKEGGGELKMTGNYVKDLLEGELKGYYRSGLPEYSYVYKAGVKNGLSSSYFDFRGEQTYADVGNVEQQVLFINGKPDGKLNSYYRAGNPRKILFYNMGILDGMYKSWHVNGLIAEEMYYKNGLLDSVKKVWDNLLGNLIKIESYNNGKKSGTWIDYNQLGDTVTVTNYTDDLLNGPFLELKYGEIESIGNYLNGEKHGFWKTGLVSNQRHAEGEYINGQKIGTWWYFDAEGKKLLKRVFDKEGYITEEELH